MKPKTNASPLRFAAGRPISWLGALLLVVALACGGGDSAEDDNAEEPTAAPTSSTSLEGSPASAAPTTAAESSPTAMPTEPAEPTLMTEELDEGLPREVRYGDLNYVLTEAVITNEDLRTYAGPDEPAISEAIHLIAHLTVTNELNNVRLNFDLNRFRLESDGAMLSPERVPGQGNTVALDAATAAEILVAFIVDEGTPFDGAVLVVGDPGYEPALLPLAGAVPELPYPINFEIDGAQQEVTSGNPCGTVMEARPLSGEVDLEGRLDPNDASPRIEDGRRAALGERFVRIEARAEGTSGQCGGANVMDRLFRLEIDGTPRGAVNSVNIALHIGEAQDFTLVYRVPVDAGCLALLVGDPAAPSRPTTS